MKRVLLMIGVLALLVGVPACGGGDDTSGTPQGTGEAEGPPV